MRPYALAIGVTAIALAVTRLTWPFFAPTPFAPVFGAVAVATHWGSGRAGLLALALAAIGGLTIVPTTGPHTINAATTIGFLAIGFVGNRLIAARNRANQALRASEAQLRETFDHLRKSEDALRRAQQAEAVGQLSAGVAHNFNNLLTVTMGYTDVLQDADGDEETRRTALTEIRRATERGATLARQMLAFGRRHDPKVTRVAVEATAANLRTMLARVIREDIDLRIDLQADGAMVMIDPHDLEQVILNLVLNSRDALPAGGQIVLQVTRTHLGAGDRRLVGSAAAGDYIRLQVRDDGVGMTPEVQAHLFEPFFTTKEVGEGTGLGLPFVHGVVQHAGGFVSVDTAPGTGTTVSVYLPPAPAEVPAPARVAPAATLTGAAPAAATILLVEDEEAVRRLAARSLTRAGYQVLEAATPSEARALFDEHAAQIALLLTDVVMPEMRGPALAELLLAKRPELPVVFMSGYAPLEASEESAASAPFLAKPFSTSLLLSTVGMEIEKTRQP